MTQDSRREFRLQARSDASLPADNWKAIKILLGQDDKECEVRLNLPELAKTVAPLVQVV